MGRVLIGILFIAILFGSFQSFAPNAVAFGSGESTQKYQPNLPPETVIMAGPPDSTDGTVYRAHFSWGGSDPDGTVDHFDIIMVDHPRSKDSIGPDGMDPVVITVPDVDDPRWTPTVAFDSVFVTLADTLRRDPRPGQGETAEDVLAHPFERWHTFFVRAVDGEGLADSTPAYRSFNAQTLAPTVELLAPAQAGVQLALPPDFVMHWDGFDPIGDDTFTEPDASRWVVIPSGVDIQYPDLFTSFPDSLYTLPERFEWSPWRDWNAPDGSGVSAAVRGLQRIGEAPGSGYYIFAVQARDEAGAITPVFDWRTPGLNNVALIRVTGASGPLLTVEESGLGVFTFAAGSRPVPVSVAADQHLVFRWSADATRYGATIDAYRYGWDLIDPGDDSSWDVDWSPTEQMTERTFQSGTHELIVQVRDELGAITEGVFEITVVPFTGERDLLFVDDAVETTVAEETRVDNLWQAVLTSVAAEINISYDPVRDTYDVVDNRKDPPPVELLFKYTAVVWDAQQDASRASALAQLGRFVDPFPARHQNASTFSLLKAYLAAGGRLWVSGFRPAREAWPTERALDARGDPVNVTNWDDPIEPHPSIDSVGTTSWVYQHGVEMFDVGASIEIDRRTLKHYCQGLNAGKMDAPDLHIDPDFWPQPSMQPNGMTGRPHIEIYNMAEAMATAVPPLGPPADKVEVLYTYVSAVPRDEMSGVVYPQTADGQPVFLLGRANASDAFFSRALCGFRPHLLTADSHLQLARHVLLREMGLVPTAVLLQEFAVRVEGGRVRIDWRLAAGSEQAEFLLRASDGGSEWTVPYKVVDAIAFTAVDDAKVPAPGASVVYSLYYRDIDGSWALLGTDEITVAAAPRVSHLGLPRPNPFNPHTTIPFELAASRQVTLVVYSLDGRRVRTLLDAVRPRGPGDIVWDGRNDLGREVPSGLYLVRMQAGGASMHRKLVLLR